MNTIYADDPLYSSTYQELTRIAGLATPAGGSLRIVGRDPVIGSRFRIGGATAVALAAHAAAVAALWETRSGRSQQIEVDVRRSTVPGLRTSSHIHQNGQPLEVVSRTKFAMPGLGRTKDGRAFWFVSHPMHREQFLASLDVLQCRAMPDEIGAAVSRWDAEDLEEAMHARKLTGVFARTREEWRAHPQGKLLASRPSIEIDKIGESSARQLGPGARPMTGVRVLDMTHVLAGPITSRTLAEHGGDVLRISSPWRPEDAAIVLDTGHGKRSAHLDMDTYAGAAQARVLADQADILVSSFRTGALDRHGLSPAEVAKRNPGIIYVSISAYGSDGPWRLRAGYDPVGQLASGLAVEEGTLEWPRLAPTLTLNDYLAAYLAAAGAVTALVRRGREGGSYHVKVSLTHSSMWIQRVGLLTPEARLSDDAFIYPEPSDFIDVVSPFGILRVPAPIAQLSDTKAAWDKPPQPFGACAAVWQS